MVNLLALSGKGECHCQEDVLLSWGKDITQCCAAQTTSIERLLAPSGMTPQPGAEKISPAFEDQRLPDQPHPQLRKSKGGVVYQHDIASISRGKNTIFELTHMLETASCRAYPEKLSGL